MKIKATVLAALFAIPTIASADETKTTESTETTKDTAKIEGEDLAVVVHRHHVNLMEIEMGKLAKKNGTAKVKSFGGMLIKDHTASDKTLMTYAKKHGLAKIPDEVPTTEEQKLAHQNMKESSARLSKLKGAEFDRDFLTIMVAGHEAEVAKIDAAIPLVTDPALAELLRKTRPVVQKHADEAKKLLETAPEVSAKD